MKKKILTFDEINNIAEKLSKYASPNMTIALIGDLGTGKTSFVKAFAKGLGVTENIKSPTFNYYLEYHSGRLPLYHFDVYRINSPDEIYDIGYEDCINNNGVVIIEWANIIESQLPDKYIQIKFWYKDDEEREVEILMINKNNNLTEEEVDLACIF